MEKMIIIYFSITIAAYDLIIGRCIELNDLLTYMNIKGQGHSLTFVNGHSFKVKFNKSFFLNKKN